MADGVQNSSVLVCFLTPAYQESANCKKELTYAMQLKKTIIPCLVGAADQPGWRPTDWLGLSIADLLYLDFSTITEDTMAIKFDELIDKIHALAGTSPAVSDDEHEGDESDTEE